MTFESLLVTNDEQASSRLTSVLAAFDSASRCCENTEAIRRLSEEEFDALIVDFDDPQSAALVVQNLHQSPFGNKTITIALLSDRSKVRHVFGAGANFVLYKPISERAAEATLRAATALLKRERRRAFRVAIQLPVQIRVENGGAQEGILLDLSEDGLDLLSAQPLCPSAVVAAQFTLPPENAEIKVKGEVAWANPNGESGIRFTDLPDSLRSALRDWVRATAPELPPENPEPVAQCKLTDLSPGACYIETESPFPEGAGIVLSLQAQEMEVQAEGQVRVMHPAFGMGIEFAARTRQQLKQVEGFIDFLTTRPGIQPQLLVTPQALSAPNRHKYSGSSRADETEDQLLHLLRNHERMTQEEFLEELRQQRQSHEVASS
jgi:DNA-binding response OmpR family regulator